MNVIKTKKVCKILNCSYNTLKKRIKLGVYPRPIKNNFRNGFNSLKIENFFKAQQKQETNNLRFE